MWLPAYAEDFSTNVFSCGDWVRSDTCVWVDTSNGWLHIGEGNINGDYADNTVDFPLPMVVEARMKLTGGYNVHYTLPALIFFYGTTDTESINITYLPNRMPEEHFGWKFGRFDYFTDVHTMGPQDINTWRTIKAIIRTDGGDLLAKADTDSTFTFVTTASWSIPNYITKIRFVQPWDAICEMDYITVSFCPLVSGDVNCDSKVTVADVVYTINYLFKGGPKPCKDCP